MGAASSGALDSAPAVTTELSACRGLDAQLGAGASLLSWALPASACPGGGGILGCVPAPCAPEPALVDSRSQLGSPLRGASPRAPPICSWVQPCALQLFKELGTLSLGRRCLLVSLGA